MNNKMTKIAVLLLGFFYSLSAFAEQKPIIDPTTRFHPVLSRGGMVSSQEAVASRVGAEILAKGGNAVDAAVATGFALAVTLPRAGNIGGGGFMMLYLAEENRTIAIDYREMAPAVAHPDMFLAANGDVDNEKARFSIHSSGVPGTVAGLLHALDKYGTLSIREVVEPAVKLAKEGIAVSQDLSESLASRTSRMQKDSASAGYFYKADGSNYQPGELWRQQDLADSLQRIADNGVDGFYKGKTADLLLGKIRRSGGGMTQQDLDNYRVVERQPVCGDYRGNRVCSMPPPSSGGVHLIQMLNILEGWDLKSLGHNSAAYLHRLIESMRRAYADRSKHLGDPDFYPVPVLALLDKGYAGKLRDGIDVQKASRSADVAPGLNIPKESMETTHYSVWDKWGNVVSNTYTLNFSYGSAISVDGAGFLLNNEMDDFSAKPGSPNGYGLLGDVANKIEAGKRPLSSMTPTLVYNAQGKPVLATGSPGGSTIITVVLQVVLNVLEFDMNVAEAVNAPRIHHQWFPDEVDSEDGISLDTQAILRNMGHRLNHGVQILGSTQTIGSDERGMLFGAADPRRIGSLAAGVE